MNKSYSIKKRILDKNVSIGLFCKMKYLGVVEMAANAGFDFIIIDMEHSNFSGYDTEDIIRAADGSGISSIVRIRNAEAEDVLHALDSGADGVQIPSITSVEEAIKVCKSTKYYPDGDRGLSLSQRSAMYGAWDNNVDYTEYSNNNSLVVVHVENKYMADKIDELVQIPQLDVVFVGPVDLSQSMGKPGKVDDIEVVEVIENIFEKVLGAGKAVGIFCGTSRSLKKYVELGASYIAFGSDVTCLSGALKDMRKSLE